MTWLKKIHQDKSQCKGQQGGKLEINNGLRSYPPDRTEISNFGHTYHQCCKHQRSDDHFDKSKKDVAQYLDVGSESFVLCRIRIKQSIEIPGQDTEEHTGKNPG